ncbi:MAG: hypothetical protein PQ612_03870 [Rickettsiales bacterium]|nr:hypothetical protein [Pseudomonadota bacterium]MDA0966249.1 hypothetical protein [Pseudomonadota bacterium]MDG4543086.1 hypothetical protein [Rickettsiales bacterium]MDG4545284.1 hypothetical protein [Rickettsiales bacterium]MDG4547733.1 hypothetical protein [Rickettsiales bacterium]
MAVDMIDFFNNSYKNITKHHTQMVEDDRKSRLLQGMQLTARTYYSNTAAELSSKNFKNLSEQLDTAHELNIDSGKVYEALFSNSFPSELPSSSSGQNSEITRMREDLDKSRLKKADSIKDEAKELLDNFLNSKEDTKEYDNSKRDLLRGVKQLRQNYPIGLRISNSGISLEQGSPVSNEKKFADMFESKKTSTHAKKVTFAEEPTTVYNIGFAR